MEWILEDWPTADLILKALKKWKVSERQAMRYIAQARKNWSKDEDTLLEQKRRLKIESLKQLKRSLKKKYQGTPFGIRSVIAVEREIISLEGLRPPTKLQIAGDPDNPTPVPLEVKHDLSKLSTEELETIINLSKKAITE